jgi:transaldolase
MNIKIFADGADKKAMLEMYENPLIQGLTTNPSLMKKAGVTNYKKFAIEMSFLIKDKPLSFEVFSDELEIMEKQGLEIASLGKNIYVKIPITNTKGESTYNVIQNLGKKGINVNVTAITTLEQVEHIVPAISNCPSGYVSVFAGRIADTGINPIATIIGTLDILKKYPNLELIWASCRELYNIIEANYVGCHIITVPNDILKKIPMLGKDLTELSLDTVKMFYNDALSSGFTI